MNFGTKLTMDLTKMAAASVVCRSANRSDQLNVLRPSRKILAGDIGNEFPRLPQQLSAGQPKL
jgi:hypothetical protein